MFRTAATIAATSLAAYLAPAAHAALAADTTQVYRTAQGAQVDLIVLAPAGDGNAVIRITGTSTPIDGLALPYKRSNSGSVDVFTTTWHGRRLSLVQVSRRGRERWELYVPGDLNHSRPLTLDEARTRALQPGELLALYDKQLKDGTHQKVAAFNRSEEQARHDKELLDSAAQADKACGGHTTARIAWSTISDDVLKQYSMGSYCSQPLATMATLCQQAPAAAAALRERVKELTCSWTGPTKLTLAAGKLEWNVDSQGSNLEDLSRQYFESLEVAAPSAPSGQAPPWGDGHTLGQRITLARTNVCTDGKGHYVVSAPAAPSGPQLYYGDAKKLAQVPVTDALGNGAFFEPRCFNPGANSSFRGLDVRVYSRVEVDEAKRLCRVTCGTRKTDLTLLPAEQAAQLLTAASYLPPQDRRTGHSLNRDEKGNYYYVDKGATPQTAQDFRLYVGPKGNMKLQKMINVVSDSQGEIFSTKSGALRFIVGPHGRESTWVQGASRVKLLAVPVEENWQLIYNELGVYVGQKRGTPCDDL
jgi:hypothetical protein